MGLYVLGPSDAVFIRVLNLDDLSALPYVVDLHGDLDIPRIGRIHADGMTLDRLESTLVEAYREYLIDPVVTVAIAEYRSQPVSVLGQVDSPGIYQIKGRTSLLDVISQAGGFKAEAGNRINLTRKESLGPIPVSNCTLNPQAHTYIAQLDIHTLMEGTSKDENIALLPNDIITVPKADLVYVFGAVHKPGGFVLSEKANISVLQALALAEGLESTAASKTVKVIRTDPALNTRSEIPVNVKTLLAGKSADVPLIANDILFIPKSTAKVVSTRTLEAITQAGTGFAIYHPF